MRKIKSIHELKKGMLVYIDCKYCSSDCSSDNNCRFFSKINKVCYPDFISLESPLFSITEKHDIPCISMGFNDPEGIYKIERKI